jgi:hypothetical protein
MITIYKITHTQLLPGYQLSNLNYFLWLPYVIPISDKWLEHKVDILEVYLHELSISYTEKWLCLFYQCHHDGTVEGMG